MGFWNSHLYVGNIIGSLIAGAFVTTSWGYSFIIPGIIIGAVGLLIFLLLVPSKCGRHSCESLSLAIFALFMLHLSYA
jgi:sugar phosphate permease